MHGQQNIKNFFHCHDIQNKTARFWKYLLQWSPGFTWFHWFWLVSEAGIFRNAVSCFGYCENGKNHFECLRY